jgi:hypothetical protein
MMRVKRKQRRARDSQIGGVRGRRRALCWEYRVSFRLLPLGAALCGASHVLAARIFTPLDFQLATAKIRIRGSFERTLSQGVEDKAARPQS